MNHHLCPVGVHESLYYGYVLRCIQFSLHCGYVQKNGWISFSKSCRRMCGFLLRKNAERCLNACLRSMVVKKDE